MRKLLFFWIMCSVAALSAVSQERIVAMDGYGRGNYVDSVRYHAIESRVLAHRYTPEGNKLKHNNGLDASRLKLQLSPDKLDMNGLNGAAAYNDSLDSRWPSVYIPAHYAVTGGGSDFVWQRNPMAYDFNREGRILSWDNGYVTGSSMLHTEQMLGAMRMASATITQNFGERWQASAGMSFQKYNLPGNIYNTYGFNGMVTYTINGNLGVSVFGTYESSPFFSRVRGLGSSLNYGGYFTLKTANDKWGVDMGAQAFRDPVTGRSKAVPIIRPFYNLNGSKLGFDIGSIIYGIFESLSGHNDFEYENVGQGGHAKFFRPNAKTLGFERHQSGKR